MSNVGTATLEIQQIDVPIAPFQVDAAGSCPEPTFFLEGGGSCSLQLRFSPLAKGLFKDVLDLAHDGDSGPDSVSIAGRRIGSSNALFGQTAG